MGAEAGVMFELQQDKMEGMPAVADGGGLEDALPAVQGLQDQAAEVELCLLPNGEGPVGAEAGVGGGAEEDEEVVERAPEDVLAHVAPSGGGIGLVGGRAGKGGAHIPDVKPHEAGMAVRPAAFISHPIGAQITFLEHMERQATGAGGGHRCGMDRAGVAVEDDIGDGVIGQQGVEGGGPILGLALEGDVAGCIGPEGLIATVEAHAMHACPGSA